MLWKSGTDAHKCCCVVICQHCTNNKVAKKSGGTNFFQVICENYLQDACFVCKISTAKQEKLFLYELSVTHN